MKNLFICYDSREAKRLQRVMGPEWLVIAAKGLNPSMLRGLTINNVIIASEATRYFIFDMPDMDERELAATMHHIVKGEVIRL